MPAYRLLYSLLTYIIFPVILLRLFWRSRHDPTLRQHWQQRFGFTTLKQSPRIWLHAVSVGETVAAKPLVEGLLKDFPNHQLLISNTTATGYNTSQRLFANRVEHCYFPYDIHSAVTRFLKRANPDLLIIMETELWPNLLHQCQLNNIPVMIANARLSERSTKGYTKILPLIKPGIQEINKIACRNPDDAQNFKQLGATSEQLNIVGNIKFDIAATSAENTNSSLRSQFDSSTKIWVAASTHAGEDEIILNAYLDLKSQYTNLLLVLVPRHPERFDAVYELCKNTGLNTQRRSSSHIFYKDCDIILGDSMGEMAFWYASADIVFMGGSFVNTGGHNPLEASVYGVPIVSGPATFNFQDVYTILCGADVAWVEDSPKALVARLGKLLNLANADLSALQQRSISTVTNNAGATDQLRQLSAELINKH